MGVVREPSTSQPIAFEHVTRTDKGIGVTWTDGHTSFFHAVWLRDCCYCNVCGDCYSSSRFVVPSEVPAEVSPSHVAIEDDGSLSVEWAPDGHRSSYRPDWLRRHCYDDESRQARVHKPTLWNGKMGQSLPEVRFDTIRESESRRLDLYRSVRDFGLVVVRAGPAERGAVEQLASMIGDLGSAAYGKVFDLAPASKIRTLGNTTKPVPPHTDEPFRYTPPGVMVLGCVKPADDGGDTILVDGFNLAETMRRTDPDAFELLCSRSQSFVRLHEGTLDQRSRARTFVLDDEGQVSGVRIHTRSAAPMDLPAHLVAPFYEAHRKLSGLMTDPQNQIRLKLGAGDAVIFDNCRVLHARTDFTDPERFLQICSVPRESFHERLRLLATTLGFPEEADMVLSAGVVH